MIRTRVYFVIGLLFSLLVLVQGLYFYWAA